MLAFPTFVRLIADALLQPHGSAHQTFQKARAAEQVTISVPSLYARLRNLPLSQGFFAAATARLHRLGTSVTNPLPATLADFQVLGFDGTKLKSVARRLKPVRAVAGNVFGGKLLVVIDLATRQALGFAAAADGETADNPLVPDAVAAVRATGADSGSPIAPSASLTRSRA